MSDLPHATGPPAAPQCNKLRVKLAGGGVALGGWCVIPSSFSAEVVASLGVDYVVVDMQHGLATESELVAMLQAIALHGSTPFVRIPLGDLATAQRALDLGSEGLIVPFVSSADEAIEVAAAVRYPPCGKRSFGPTRACLRYGVDPTHANQEIMCLVQIETREALAHARSILQVPGVDGAYVGPADLALSLGLSIGQQSDELDAALDSVVDACRATGKIPAIYAYSGRASARALARGYTMVAVGGDATWLRAGYQHELDLALGPVDGSDESPY